MSKIPKDLARSEARLAQMQGAQLLLHSMEVLEEHTAGFQMEIEGVIQSIIVRRVTQAEFSEFIKATASAAARGARPAPPAP